MSLGEIHLINMWVAQQYDTAKARDDEVMTYISAKEA